MTHHGGLFHAVLAAALLIVTALVRVPMELCAASTQDLSTASADVVLVVFASGLSLFLALFVVLLALPPRPKRYASVALVGISVYAWIRSGFFPGPSLNLNGITPTTDLSTGTAGLLVPLLAGALVAWLGARQARVVTTLLTVVLCGSLLRVGGVVASIWNAVPPPIDSASRSLSEWSRGGNVLLLILDSLQSDVFEEVLEGHGNLATQLDGFRYYRLASSSAPTTYLSLPTIHSGRAYQTNQSVLDFFHESIQRHSVLNRFAAAGYGVDCLMDGGTHPNSVEKCVGVAELTRSRTAAAIGDASRLIELGIYRVLPDGPRRAILKGGLGPLRARNRSAADLAAFRSIIASSRLGGSAPKAKLIHTMLAHPPFVFREDCSLRQPIEARPAALDHATCALSQVADLLRQLEALGVYEDSNIVITADHGYGIDSGFVAKSEDLTFQRLVGSLNPVVLVKPARSRGPLAVSDAPIELADLADALCDEGHCSPAEGLRHLEDVSVGRERVAHGYVWKNEYWAAPKIPGLIRYSIRGDLREPESWSRKAAP